MKISGIQVDSFGHWKGLEIPDLSSQVTVIHGPNEAGKSTLLHLIRAVLYGFSPQQHARFIPPRYPGDIGGSVTLGGPNGRYRVRRCLPPQPDAILHDAEGNLSIESLDGGLQGRHLLPTLLCGVDDAIFRNVFAVGLSEMQHLATLSDTEAAQQLYGLAAGADRVSVSQVSRALQAARQRQLDPNAAQSITELLRRRDELRDSGVTTAPHATRWFALVEEQQKLGRELESLERQRKRFGQALTSSESRSALREQFKRCRQLQRRVASEPDHPQIPADVVKRLGQLTSQIRTHRTNWEKIRGRRRDVRDQARRISASPALLHHAETIESLHQRAAWIGELNENVTRAATQVEETEFELQGEFERIGLRIAGHLQTFPLVTDAMVEQLREPARAARKLREKIEACTEVERRSREEAEQLQRRLDSELNSTQSVDVTRQLNKLEQRGQLLRSRIQLDARIESAQRKLQSERRESHRLMKKELLPWRLLMLLGIVFSIGMTLLLAACFGRTLGLDLDDRWSLGILGVAVGIAPLMMRGLVEFAARREADACRDEIESGQKQIHRWLREREQVTAQLPADSEPWQAQLQANEDERVRLADLQPLETARQESLQRMETARSEKETATRLQSDARQRWKNKLQEFQLPTSMTPSQFGQIAHGDSNMGQLRQRLVGLHAELDEKRAELKEVQERVDNLFERSAIVPESDRLEDQIEQLYRALVETRDKRQQRDNLHRRWRDDGREQQQVARDAKRLQQKKQELVARYGVVDAQELKARAKKRRAAVKQQRDRDQAIRQLAGKLGTLANAKKLRQWIDAGTFERQLRSWESEYDKLQQRINQLHERRGELNEQVRHVTAQRASTSTLSERGELESRLTQQLERWQVLAATSLMLDSVRKSYEADRQPATLAEASGYMKRLTNGRYARIWTPFGESSLCVDDQDGRPIQVEHLSRGTREMVFLSLRLSLAAAYGRRGSGLPLILDDVFVNFDAERSRWAAETVVDFAQNGQQVLVFTCHDHIRDVFHRMGIDLRELPVAAEVASAPFAVRPEPPYEAAQPSMAVASLSSHVAEEIPEVPLVAPEPEVVVDEAPMVSQTQEVDALPLEDDPELDHELLYGAPDYEPGHDVPEEDVRSSRSEPKSSQPAPRPARRKPTRTRTRPGRSLYREYLYDADAYEDSNDPDDDDYALYEIVDGRDVRI